MALVTTRAVLLRSFPYGETSRVLRFYTEDLGGVGVMGKGVRSRKAGSGLETFAQGALTVFVKPTRELQTLRDFAPSQARRGLAADVLRFAGASVLADLVLRHAAEEPNAPLFDALAGGLDRLEGAPAAERVATLLREAWRLVDTLGYRPVLEACVVCGTPVTGEQLARFDFAAGGIRCARCVGEGGGPRLGPGARAQLLALLQGDAPPALDRPRAHLRLLSDFVTWHLAGGRPLPSFRVLAELLAGDPGEEDGGA